MCIKCEICEREVGDEIEPEDFYEDEKVCVACVAGGKLTANEYEQMISKDRKETRPKSIEDILCN